MGRRAKLRMLGRRRAESRLRADRERSKIDMLCRGKVPSHVAKA